MRRSATKRALRVAAWVGAGLVAVALVGALAVPLALRGPRFVALVERSLPPMRGTLTLGGGGLSAGAVFAWLFRRPIGVWLDEVRILDPEGVEVFYARELSGAVELELRPLRVVIHRLTPRDARWRFGNMKESRGVGFIAAFRPPRRGDQAQRRSDGESRRADRQREARRSGERGGSRRDAWFALEDARLEKVDVTFDFRGWGLALEGVTARGGLRAGMVDGEPQFSFDVREVLSPGGGHLRILSGRRATSVPFDRVAIARVGVPAEAPGDLLLQVEQAETGASVLSGHAWFRAIFIGRGERRPSMEIDARWTSAAEALNAIARSRNLRGLTFSGRQARLGFKAQSSFRDLDLRFDAGGLDVDFRGYQVLDAAVGVTVRGPPFVVELAQLSFAGPAGGRAQASAAWDAAQDQARLQIELEDLVTTPLLPPYLRTLLGGRAMGHLALRARPRSRQAEIAELDLGLERTRRGPLPRLARLYKGAPRRRPPPSSAEALVARIGDARFEDGALSVRGVGASAFGGTLQARAALAIEEPDTHRPLRVPRLDLRLGVGGINLRRAFPGSGLGGDLSFRINARGPLDDMRAHLGFVPGATLEVFDQPYGLPTRTTLRVAGNLLRLFPVRLRPPGGGLLAVQGRLRLGQFVDLAVHVEQHRLDRIPFVSSALPALTGRLSGELRLRGDPAQPVLAGGAQVEDVALGGVPLGGGRVVLRPHGAEASAIEGELFGRLSVGGRLRTGRAGPGLELRVDARQLVLDPFLPPLPILQGARLLVSGRFDLSAGSRGPPELGAEFSTIAFAYGCGPGARARPRGQSTCVHFENAGPIRLRAHGGARAIELEPARLVAPGSAFSVWGKLRGEQIEAGLEGRLALALLEPLFRRWPMVVGGAVAADFSARGSIEKPDLRGSLAVVDPLTVRGRKIPLFAEVTEGRLLLRDRRVVGENLRVRSDGLSLTLSGNAPLGGEADRGSSLSLHAAGQVSGPLFTRLFPEHVAHAEGRIDLDATLEGTLDDPRFTGEAQVFPLALRLYRENLSLRITDGRISAKGRTVRVDSLTVAADPGGRFVVGPPGHPAEVVVGQLAPLQLEAVNVPVVGRDLHLTIPGLRLEDGRLGLRLARDAQGPFTLRGEVELLAGRFLPLEGRDRQRRREPGPPRKRDEDELRPRLPALLLDLNLKSDGRHFVVDPGWLPDLHLGLDVDIRGSARRPRVDWNAYATGIYSAIALFLFRLFS